MFKAIKKTKMQGRGNMVGQKRVIRQPIPTFYLDMNNDLYWTSKRKRNIIKTFCEKLTTKICFADVGSGGRLKHPWDLIPKEKIYKVDFDPINNNEGELPICISNKKVNKTKFYLSWNESCSSLHKPYLAFIQRYNFWQVGTTKTINVQCITLDELFENRDDKIDIIDINVEGHDFQILQGASSIIDATFIKLIKIEFELTEVWENQGSFADIDTFLRNKGYVMANINIQSMSTENTKKIHYAGEPTWGKAFYVPNNEKWIKTLSSLDNDADVKDSIFKALALYTATDLLGYAFDLLDNQWHFLKENNTDAEKIKNKIFNTYKYTKYETAVRYIDIAIRTILHESKYRPFLKKLLFK